MKFTWLRGSYVNSFPRLVCRILAICILRTEIQPVLSARSPGVVWLESAIEGASIFHSALDLRSVTSGVTGANGNSIKWTGSLDEYFGK